MLFRLSTSTIPKLSFCRDFCSSSALGKSCIFFMSRPYVSGLPAFLKLKHHLKLVKVLEFAQYDSMRFRRAFCEFWQSLEWLLVVYTLYQYQSKSNQVCPCLACGSCLYVIVSDLKEKQHHLSSSGSHAISLLVYSRETIYKVIRRYLFT